MTLDRQLLTFMPHSVTIFPYTAKNTYGEETFGSSRTVAAYVEPASVMSAGRDVNQQVRPSSMWVNDLTITIRDKITLPDGTQPEILSVAIVTEVPGLDHTVVTFQ